MEDSASIYWGSSVIPLVYVEVLPLQVEDTRNDEARPEFTDAFIKAQLMLDTFESILSAPESSLQFQIQWDGGQTFAGEKRENHVKELSMKSGILVFSNDNTADNCQSQVVYLQQNNPVLPYMWPCQCRAFALLPPYQCNQSRESSSRIVVTDSTIFRVLPLSDDCSAYWKDQLTGEIPEPIHSSFLSDEVAHFQNKDSIKELSLRMRLLLSRSIWIGTTNDAINLRKRQKKRMTNFQSSMKSFMGIQNDQIDGTQQTLLNNSQSQKFLSNTSFQEGALLVHSPDHGSGKTLLVETIARKYCDVVHIMRPGPLLAKYGIHMDAALETIMHEIILAAAVRKQSICVIIDHLESILPASLSGCTTGTQGDAANPILDACAAYLKNLTKLLKTQQEIPFPTKNPLYNVNGTHGCVLKVRVCLVAIVTCPDDGWRSQINKNSNASGNEMTILNALVVGRYRLPSLSASTRLEAFRWALQQEQIGISVELEQQLPYLSASAVWARGPDFRRVAKQIRYELENTSENKIASLNDFKKAFVSVGKMNKTGSDVQFLATENVDRDQELFGSVGGNVEAKSALEDALGVHPRRRKLLSSFGLSPPNGLVLYGPPGTGKTLLAKAVARLLRSANPSNSSIGGAFISLRSTDVARAEVGSGEKMLVSAFEIARKNAPSVVFIDEFQALFTERSNGGSGRLSTTLFQCMDNIKQWQEKHSNLDEQDQEEIETRVLVLAATNTPWMIDKAFLRPGRFDRAVHVGLPDLNERKSILKLYIMKMKTRFQENHVKLHEVCKSIAEKTKGYSGADLAALCRTAAIQCLLKNNDYIDEVDFDEALDEGSGASSSESLVAQIKEWRP